MSATPPYSNIGSVGRSRFVSPASRLEPSHASLRAILSTATVPKHLVGAIIKDVATEINNERPVLRDATGAFMRGTARPAGAGPQPGQRCVKLRPLDTIIAELEIKLGRNCDPVVTLIELAAGHDEFAKRTIEERIIKGTLNPEDKTDARTIAEAKIVPLDVRTDAAKAVARFIRPMLAQTVVTGPGGGPITSISATLPIKELMSDDLTARMIEDLTIAIAAKSYDLSVNGEENEL